MRGEGQHLRRVAYVERQAPSAVVLRNGLVIQRRLEGRGRVCNIDEAYVGRREASDRHRASGGREAQAVVVRTHIVQVGQAQVVCETHVRSAGGDQLNLIVALVQNPRRDVEGGRLELRPGEVERADLGAVEED